MKNTMTNNIKKVKDDLIAELDKRIADKIIEKTNADLLKKLIEQAGTINEAIMIAELGTTYKRTGFHFDKRLEKMTDTIKYFKKNKKLSFSQDKNTLTHKLIIGDNYDALLNLLIEYRGKIDVIYIDPPYGKDSMGEFAKTNYENAITRDNLLSMLYPRLILARQLLSDNGVIFCSIDDKNQAYVKGLFDEIFWESNFIANLIVNSAPAGTQSSNNVSIQHSYCICYAKNIGHIDFIIDRTDEELENSYSSEDERGNFFHERLWKRGVGGKKEDVPTLHFPVYFNEKTNEIKIDDEFKNENNFIKIIPYQTASVLGRWTWSREKMKNERNRLLVKKVAGEWRLHKKVYEDEEKGKLPFSIIGAEIGRTELGGLELKDIIDAKKFDYPKPVALIKYLLNITNYKDSIILDFFAGSGTTGQSVLELNKQDGGKRQFILATANEITDTTPNGIVNDVTSKRLKRVMTGECYDGTKDFKWNEKNKPLGDTLDVYDIATVANFESTKDKTPFDVIDETLYGQEKLGVKEKIKWVCENFEGTQKTLEDK